LGAFPETGAEAVAVFFRGKSRLAVHNADRSFGARWHTLPASVAFIFINMDYFPFYFHGYSLPRHR
jgi:hypothetical protein